MLLSYTQTISLSLFFFNMLPFSILDGGQALDVLIEMGNGQSVLEMDDLEAGSRRPRRGRWRWLTHPRIRKALSTGTLCMGLLVSLDAIFSMI